jgi:hypothetical protein
MKRLVIAGLVASSLAFGLQQQPGTTDKHSAGVDSRGDHEMGFSHEKTAHHFTLLTDGGLIEVVSKDANDAQSREEIQGHLNHIVMMFRDNNFEIPMLIHDRVPPGVPVMKKKRDVISYSYVPTEQGGFVRLKTADPEALKAIHQFLVFQIRDHRTGDSEEVRIPNS